MKKRKTPQEKKNLSYDKDHKIGHEYPKTYRRTHHRRKQIENQSYRRRLNSELGNLQSQSVLDESEAAHLKAIRRKKVNSYGGYPLRKWVADRTLRRIKFLLLQHWKNPYNPEKDRERFSKFLQSQMSSNTAFARSFSLYLNELLELPELPVSGTVNHLHETEKIVWFESYLKDVPEWEARLRTWIREINSENPAT